MRTYQSGTLTLTTPDQKVFLRDFNAVTVSVSVGCKSLTATLRLSVSGVNDQKIFKTTVINSNEVVFDLSYFFQSLGSGATIILVEALVDYTTILNTSEYQLNINNRYDTISLSNGYSLPNRQHYSETSVFAPPLEVYKKGMNNPNATEVELEFGAPNTVILNNQRHEKNSSFTINPSQDCKTVVDVDIQGEYLAWKESNASWTYGITSIWCNHVVFDEKSDIDALYRRLFALTAVDTFVDATDEYQLSQTNVMHFAGVLLKPMPNRPNRYKIVALTLISTTNATPRVAFLEKENYYITTDIYDDFLIIDYASKRGYNRPTYHVTDENDNQITDLTFVFYNWNRNNVNSMFETSIAKGSCFMGVNTMTRSSGSVYERFQYELGIYPYPTPNSPDDLAYDYSLINRIEGSNYIYELHTLAFGHSTTTSLDNLNTYWQILLQEADIYASIHDKDPVFSTMFPYSTGGGFNQRLDNNIPIYCLWRFLSFGRAGDELDNFDAPYVYFIRRGSQVDYNTPYIEASYGWYCFSTKQYDNAINIFANLMGVSFMAANISLMIKRASHDYYQVTPQRVYLFPSPTGDNWWRTSEIILRNGSLYYDYDGNVIHVNPDDIWDTQSGTYDYPCTIYVSFSDGARHLLSLKDNDVNQFYGSSSNVVVAQVKISSSSNETVDNVSYYMFPYNCAIPTIQSEDEVLYKYALMPAQIDSLGGFSDGGLHTQLCIKRAWCSPFNVGRTINGIDGTPILQTPMTNGWFALSPRLTVPYRETAIVRQEDTSSFYNNYYDFFSDLFNGYEMVYFMGYDYQDTGRPLLSYVGDNSTTINAPCEDIGRVYHDFTKGAISNYKIVSYSICDTDQIFWLKYENMDGFVRWLPLEIKRRVYENSLGDFKFVTPSQSTINAYPMQSPLSLQEKITCFIGDVPQDLHIEDVLYSPYLTGINYDGSASFECVLEENEIIRDTSQELEDFVLNFIKKK